MELTEAQQNALKFFRQLSDNAPVFENALSWEHYMTHQGHSLWRAGILSSEEFAIFMDEVVCF